MASGNNELEDAGIVADAILTYLAHGRVSDETSGMEEAVARARNDAVEQVLLQNGFPVWLAYHMATRTETGVAVRAAASRLMPPVLATMASIIKAWAPTGESTRRRAGQLFHERQTAKLMPSSRVPGIYIGFEAPGPSRLSNSLSPPDRSWVSPTMLLPPSTPHIKAPHPVAADKSWGSAWPLLKNLPSVFPPSIRTAIGIHREHCAAVEVLYKGPERSELVIEVKAGEVRAVAMQLFEVNIHVWDKRRYLLSEKGLGVLPQICTLFAASMDNVKRYLGGIISARLSDSLVRKNEVEHGDPLTSLVSMDFEQRDDSPGHIRVIMGCVQMRPIEDLLFPLPAI